MSMEPTCDVRRTSVGVERYGISVVELDRKTKTVKLDEKGNKLNPVLVLNKDLCPEALERLLAKIEANTCPPVKRKKGDAPEALESKAAASNNGKGANVKK